MTTKERAVMRAAVISCHVESEPRRFGLERPEGGLERKREEMELERSLGEEREETRSTTRSMQRETG